MRRLTGRSTFVVAVLASVATGCGSGSAIPLDQFNDEFAKTLCRRYYTCCDVIERGADPELGSTEAECVAVFTAAFAGSGAGVQADIDAGLLVYHGDKARACLDDLATLSCEEYGMEFDLNRIPNCVALAEGKVALGDTCSNSDRCTSRFCAANPAGTAMTCQVPPALPTPQPIGAPCDQDAACLNNHCPYPIGTEPRVCALPTECNGV
jgi:hypothetical protein